MTSQTGKQIIIIHIMPGISRGKGSEAMKYRQLLEYNVRNIFPQKPCKKDTGRLVPDLL